MLSRGQVVVPAAHPNCRPVVGPSGYVISYYSKSCASKEAAKIVILLIVKKEIESSEKVVELLTEIRNGIVKGNAYAAHIAANTKTIRQDVTGIRDGRTGADARLHEDPLKPSLRRQVELVKKRYYALLKENPFTQLLPICRQVRKEDRAAGIAGGYRDDNGLNSRASKEIKREQAGHPPF